MALNRLLSAALLAAVLGGSAWLAQDAQANFADAAGFSGRGGATCVACHTEAPAPLTAPPATAVLEGLPAEWDAGQAYALTIRVEGGPPAVPAPAPQGGFDLSLDGGVISLLPEDVDKLRTVGEQEATYLGAGTLQREWQVVWTAPTLDAQPRTVNAWLAVVAANGNHVIALGLPDGGERFDASAALTATTAPSPATQAAWRALPLLAPTAEATAEEGGRLVVEGRSPDGNATQIAWRVDGGEWTRRDAGPEWRVRVEGLAPGAHTFEVRSEGADRASPITALSADVPGFALGLPGGKDTPPAPLPPVLALLVLVPLALRSRRP